ncbi:hypothetical protein AK830_g11552 [Neonectria ditissima]|uniref:ATPase AAA-type core domain-containing protein n=1 Tax=Neonectria ditissima TaxID=78410 RepID=A0A0P7AR36_9HYPO|nr:hypothetical protein AK830_g11552 [Neonectria ditissima]
MGSVLVAAMFQEGVGEPPAKKFHPFFTKGPPTEPQHSSDPVQDTSQLDAPPPNTEPATTQRKRRKTDPPAPQNENDRKKPRRNRTSEGPPIPTASTPLVHEERDSDDASTGRVSCDFPTPPLSDTSVRPMDHPQPITILPRPEMQTIPMPTASITPPKTKKVLKWNPKTGTLGSPPKPKLKNTPTRVVCVKYGRDDTTRKEMGDKISQILEGKLLIPPTPTKPRAPRGPKKSKDPVTTQTGLPKITHPFFTGKAKRAQPTSAGDSSAVQQKLPPPRNSIFMSTPVSPKKSRIPFSLDKIPQFGIKSGGVKEPGAMHPLWPAKDMSHIHGLGTQIRYADSMNHNEPPKKSKGSIVTIRPSESVLGRHCEALNLGKMRETFRRDNNNFEPVPEELRIPKRHFESGRKLQKRIRSELRTYRPATIDDVNLGPDEFDNTAKRTQPAIRRFFEALETGLSAYDRSTCESQSWVQKYAPVTASQVLQAGKEAFLLKEWLQTLRVQSVGTGSADGGGKGKTKSDSAPRKRRKKDKLDGFIVDSDEEANVMDEVSEDEDDWAPAGSGVTKKTVIRSGDAAAKGSKDQPRLTNAVVVSGPHGSGKTAAVYAVAKELGFEIFEINSSSRRSGKDILERVGDMTRNHLVQHHHADSPAECEEEDEVSRDLKSGKQGMMTTFFTRKPATVPKKATRKPAEQAAEPNKQSSVKNQKQSLILLEEVDILYEEDKQFWATLMGMMAQSKRPFIMTCNDESLVPLQSLSLHGIIRFSPPPTDLAVDLCLLVAVNEGHLLRRPAVEALYKSRNNDLRATLTELNYWCQISVGDRRGGFDWFVLRWPKGSDLDENGNVIRVVSEDTYCKGMGWIGRDLISTCPSPLVSEEESMQQSWDSWNMDLGDWNNSRDLQSWAQSVSETSTRPRQNFDTLAAYDEFCDNMSGADILSSGGFGMGFQESLDPTLPEISAKTKDDFVLGRPVIDADPKTAPSSPHVALSISLRSLAKGHLFRATHALGPESNSILGPATEKQAVSVLAASFDHSSTQLSRLDFAFAFDPIAVSEKATTSTHLDPSVFDRTLKVIVVDVAPWVRGIVEFDHQLMLERLKLSNLLSEGGKRKRMRTTRSAYSALEGGERKATRRERYFGDSLNAEFVRRTAGGQWKEAAAAAVETQGTGESCPSSPSSEGE